MSTSNKESLEVSKTSMSYNTTSETPRESIPRRYSPVGLGLGLFFGLAAITAMIIAIIFVYRRHYEGAANDRYVSVPFGRLINSNSLFARDHRAQTLSVKVWP